MGSCCGSGDDGVTMTVGKKRKLKRKGTKANLVSNFEYPNDDESIYKEIYQDKTDGNGVKKHPRFTVKIPESELSDKRKEFWGK